MVEGQYSLANTVPLTKVFNVAPALTRRWQPNHNRALFHFLCVYNNTKTYITSNIKGSAKALKNPSVLVGEGTRLRSYS